MIAGMHLLSGEYIKLMLYDRLPYALPILP